VSGSNGVYNLYWEFIARSMSFINFRSVDFLLKINGNKIVMKKLQIRIEV